MEWMKLRLTRDIKTCTIQQSHRIPRLIGELQNLREACTGKNEPDLIFYGVAMGLETISDYRIFVLQIDDRLNELTSKVDKIREREGLEEDEYFDPGDPDTPEDYEALNIELDYRIDEIRADIMREFGEEELSRLFVNNRKEYIQRYYSGWRILERNNPDMLKIIDEEEQDELEEENLNI